MVERWFLRPNTYHDSVKLMRVSEALGLLPGIERAAAVMATPLNLDLLLGDDLLPADVRATPEDLLVTILGENQEAVDSAVIKMDDLLVARSTDTGDRAAPAVHTLERAAHLAGSNLAVIAVPGPYAAAESLAALRSGMHVFLFSDNVSLDDEVRMKKLAAERDLLMMGPDCGTAIIGGVGLGFANRVDAGPVGIVGASGTGIQQVCCLLDDRDIGIAQAIGTGGRDLSTAVGGSMTRRAIAALENDARVRVLVVISKPSDAEVARQLHRELVTLSKPVVVCLLGMDLPDDGAVRSARTLTDAARLAAGMLGSQPGYNQPSLPRSPAQTPGKRVYGLFAGGTLCTEAELVLDSMGTPHHLVDLGDDRYTRGRAHPMIDPRLRASMLADLQSEDDVGAVMIDVILGDLAHGDPAGSLIPGLERFTSSDRGAAVPIVVSLLGTRKDPQGLEQQRSILEETGAHVFASNAQAAAYAADAVRGAS